MNKQTQKFIQYKYEDLVLCTEFKYCFKKRIRRIFEGVRAKNLQATLLFVDFTKAFDPFTEERWNKSY